MIIRFEIDVTHHADAGILRSIAALATKHDLVNMENRIMATVQQLKDAIAAEAAEVKARVDALEAQVQSLKDQIAAGGTITEAQLDDVLTGIQGIFTPPSAPVPPVV